MSDVDYDVLVAGAGPAGSTAARALSDLGYDVGLFERETFPRHKTCGGLITEKTIDLLKRVFDYSVSTLRNEGVLDYMSQGYEVHFRDTALAEGRSNLRFFFVKREVYDEFLAREAKASGVDLHEGVGIDEPLENETGVRTNSDREVTANHLIGCDGVHSPIRKTLIESGRIDEPEGDWFHNLAMALEAYVDRDELPMDLDRPILHLGVINWGYGWIFPHSDRCLIGVGGLRRKNQNFRETLDDYREFLGIENVQCEIKGHPVPYGNFIHEPYSHNTLLAGDAAGLVDALSAEGIFYAQRTGELAAHAIHRSEKNQTAPGAVYQTLLDNHVLPEMRGSKFFRPLAFADMTPLQTYALKTASYFVMEKMVELIHGERVYNFFWKHGDYRHIKRDFE